MSVPIGSRIFACRGCCCGSPAKHPDTDHQSQLAALRELAESLPGGRLSVLRCLGRCEHSNLVVVSPASGEGLIWFGAVLEPEVVDELGCWLRSGGDPAAMSSGLAAHVVHDATVTEGTAS